MTQQKKQDNETQKKQRSWKEVLRKHGDKVVKLEEE